MAIKLHFFKILLLLVLCQIFCKAVSSDQQCREKEEQSLLGMMLRGHIFKKITGATLGDVCLWECYRDVRCQSFNYVFTQDVCELSSRTKEARPEDFVPNSERYYFKRGKNRVALGSIPDLPAESCKEIKLSEEGQGVSGKNWLLSIIPGKAILAYCDMMNEDIDECKSELDDCHSSASCTNTVGSYSCACNDGYLGDGKSCNIITECHNYQNLTGSYRKNTSQTPSGDVKCDSSLGPDWFRFQDAAGTKMPTSCVSTRHCGTDAPGWLNGAHPEVADGQVIRNVCFNWKLNCCRWAINIQVRNCGSYFVYYISGTPSANPCSLGYCGSD